MFVRVFVLLISRNQQEKLTLSDDDSWVLYFLSWWTLKFKQLGELQINQQLQQIFRPFLFWFLWKAKRVWFFAQASAYFTLNSRADFWVLRQEMERRSKITWIYLRMETYLRCLQFQFIPFQRRVASFYYPCPGIDQCTKTLESKNGQHHDFFMAWQQMRWIVAKIFTQLWDSFLLFIGKLIMRLIQIAAGEELSSPFLPKLI